MDIHLEKEKTALLLMDLQKDIIDPASPMAQHAGFADMVRTTGLLDRVSRVADAARAANMLVITVRNDFSIGNFPHYPQRGEFCKLVAAEHDRGEIFRPGSWGYEIDPRVAPKAGEPVVGKMHMGAFSGSNLDQVLREKGITDIAMIGVATSFVVTATTWSALNYGYSCIVIEDCCTAGSKEAHEAAIAGIRPVSDICTAEDFIRAIQANS